MRPLVLTWVVSVLALAGCGSGGARGTADAGAVIRGWADDVREGRYAAAARRFALPATVADGGPAIRLRTAEDVDAFSRGLTCGAVVTATRAIDGGRTLATFRLTERAGAVAPCGTGVGQQALADHPHARVDRRVDDVDGEARHDHERGGHEGHPL